jgi:hypothetical protein
MKALYGMLIGIVTVLVLALMVAAGTAEAINLESWDQQISGAKRFKVLSDFGGAAVLDKETQLVWEQAPSLTGFSWHNAQSHCNNLTTGGRLGWRLPTLQELASLVDPSVPAPGPTVPPGHPFTNVPGFSPFAWSATSWSGAIPSSPADWAYLVSFNGLGTVLTAPKVGIPFPEAAVWCVRGGQGVDPQ